MTGKRVARRLLVPGSAPFLTPFAGANTTAQKAPFSRARMEAWQVSKNNWGSVR